MKPNQESAVAQFIANHANEFDPAKIKYTCGVLVRLLASKKLPITVQNLETCWQQVVDVVAAIRPEAEPKPDDDPIIEAARQKLSALSADELKEFLSDPESAEQANSIYAHPRPKPAATAATVTKPAAKKIVLSEAEQAVERMTAAEYKRGLSGADPKAKRIIDAALAAEEKRRRDNQ